MTVETPRGRSTAEKGVKKTLKKNTGRRKFRQGDKVVIRGLKGAKQHNGKDGVITGLGVHGRWNVRLLEHCPELSAGWSTEASCCVYSLP